MRHLPGKRPRTSVDRRAILLTLRWAAFSFAIAVAIFAASSQTHGESLLQVDDPEEIKIDERVIVDDDVRLDPEEQPATPTPVSPKEIEIAERVTIDDSVKLPPAPVVSTPTSPDLPVELELREAVRVRDAIRQLSSERDTSAANPTEVPTNRTTPTPISIEIIERVGVGDSAQPDSGGGVEPESTVLARATPDSTASPQATSTPVEDASTPSSGTCSSTGGGRADLGLLLLLGAPALFAAGRKLRRN